MSPLQMRRRREPREVEGFDRGHTAGLHNAASRVAIISLAAAVTLTPCKLTLALTATPTLLSSAPAFSTHPSAPC